MIFLKNIKHILLVIMLGMFSINSWAETYKYHADVKGMVCAFCAYSVSKNISKLPGVDADSVNVDLKLGQLDFISSKKVSAQKLSELFSESGFTINNLNFTKTKTSLVELSDEISLDLKIDVFNTDQFSGVIEAIGNIAASTPSRLIIEAPASQEDTILKPLLMGRQQVIKVRFIPAKVDKIHLQLFKGNNS